MERQLELPRDPDNPEAITGAQLADIRAVTSFRAMSRLGSGCSADGEAFATKLENFCRAGTAKPSYGDEVTGHPVYFDNLLGMQKWLNCGYVDLRNSSEGLEKPRYGHEKPDALQLKDSTNTQ